MHLIAKEEDMTMTFIYGIFALLFLLAIFLVAYRMRGARFAIGLSVAAFFFLVVSYVVLVILVTSKM
jgi:hypothetical protein